jgi:hypothetical protein
MDKEPALRQYLSYSTLPYLKRNEFLEKKFYKKGRRMFWLVHIDATSAYSNGWNFHIFLDFKSNLVEHDSHAYRIMQWYGRSKQFIEKWKRSNAHVCFDFKGHIFYLANARLAESLNGGISLSKGEFALCALTQNEFIDAIKRPNPESN